MTEAVGRDGGAVAHAARELDRLHELTREARAVLAGLRGDVAEAEVEAALGISRSARLLEANEQLVLALLRAQVDAENSELARRAAPRLFQFDGLTGLPNRVLLLDRFTRAIAAARRHGVRVAVLCVDVNNFRHINETLGHAVGDQVLQRVAQCLASVVRDADTVSRHGGDEFLLLLTEVTESGDPQRVADKIIAELAAPSRVGDHLLRLTVSIGISVFPDDGEHAETLIDRADAAMLEAMGDEAGGLARDGGLSVAEVIEHALAPGSLQHALSNYELALAENDRRHALLREANEQLLMAALGAQSLQAAAEQAQRQQTHFLAVLAHELRNPLTPIRTAAALLPQVRSEELPRMQAIIERQVAHMSRLVGDLLDVSRVNTGKLRLERRPMDLAETIGEAIEACRPAMATRLQEFDVDVPAGPLEVYGDSDRLAQVFSNLLDNAYKYTPPGGRIGLLVRVAGAAIVVTVSDSGIGITAEALPHVFDPFVQDTHAIGYNGAGLGIGLTVVRELVEAHGGTVVAASDGSGLGSRFVVTLPLVTRPAFAAGATVEG